VGLRSRPSAAGCGGVPVYIRPPCTRILRTPRWAVSEGGRQTELSSQHCVGWEGRAVGTGGLAGPGHAHLSQRPPANADDGGCAPLWGQGMEAREARAGARPVVYHSRCVRRCMRQCGTQAVAAMAAFFCGGVRCGMGWGYQRRRARALWVDMQPYYAGRAPLPGSRHAWSNAALMCALGGTMAIAKRPCVSQYRQDHVPHPTGSPS
jgi:hypothetical protein